MRQVRWKDPCPEELRSSVITLGYFDGLHQGHRALMKASRRMADRLGSCALMMSFEPHPSHVLVGHQPIPLIYGMAEKEWILKESGWMDHMVIMSFEPELMNMEPEYFVEDILFRRWHAVGIVVGDNFRFGRKNRGDAAMLRELCQRAGVCCEIVTEVDDEGVRVSSSRIRELLSQGRIEDVNRLLGRPYMLFGSVSRGSGLGHRCLVPTVNLTLAQGRQYPASGVYVSRTYTADGAYESVSNIGHNPTVGEGLSLRCETYLMEFDEEIYGKDVRVEFYRYLRPEQRFRSMDELRQQQIHDIQNARAYFAEEKGNEE